MALRHIGLLNNLSVCHAANTQQSNNANPVQKRYVLQCSVS